MMLEHLCNSPYGKVHGYQRFDGYHTHFNRRILLKNEVGRRYFRGTYLELENRSFDPEDVLRQLGL